MTRRRDPITEARRLRAIADDALERLSDLESQRLAALDGCGHGPSPAAIEAARASWEKAEAAASAGARVAQREVTLA